MRKSRHSEIEMVNAVRQLENGVSVDLVARDHGESYLRQREAGMYQDGQRPGVHLREVQHLVSGERDNAQVHPARENQP